MNTRRAEFLCGSSMAFDVTICGLSFRGNIVTNLHRRGGRGWLGSSPRGGRPAPIGRNQRERLTNGRRDL